MKILVLNAGSSSLKYQLLDMDTENIICKGGAERIGIDNSRIEHKINNQKYEIVAPMKNHTEALQYIIKEFTNVDHTAVKDIKEIDAIGHRVLHSGVHFTDSTLITDETLKFIEEDEPLGPLHMPANIACIKACRNLLDVPMVATFDTAFHMSMPNYAYMYGIKYEDYEKYHVRKYGFHGTSHKFISQEAIKILGLPKDSKIVTCHLGNGSSIAAVKDGKCIDTSMGFTPLEGLIMGTRSGDIDPAAVEYLMEKKGYDIKKMLNYLNKESGFLGVSQLSSDSRDLNEAAAGGNKKAKLALDMFYYRIKRYIGAYAAAMGGLDCIVFAGGIGENSENAREESLKGLEFLGVELDLDKNIKLNRKSGIISKDTSKVKVIIIPTNEELVIARDTKNIVLNGVK